MTQVPCNTMPVQDLYDYKPSYNAVQLNLKQPTLNAQPIQNPVQLSNTNTNTNAKTQNEWIA